MHTAQHNMPLKSQHHAAQYNRYPICRPTHHHAVHHIAEFNMLHSIPLNTTSRRTTQHHAVQHNSHDTQHADQHIIMLYIIPLTSSCYPTGHNKLPNKSPNTICCAIYLLEYCEAHLAAEHNMLCNMLPIPICCATCWPIGRPT